MKDRVIAYINVKALQHNVGVVRSLTKNCKILAMVKAYAYGHGLVRIAKALQQVDGFGVATLQEALQLRENGISARIVVMQGFFYQQELPVFIDHNIEAVIHCQQQIEILKQIKLSQPLSIWLKMDTGMHRLGFSPADFPLAYQQLEKLEAINKPFVVMTHLADADNQDKAFTQQQLNLFTALTKDIPMYKSIGNSAAICQYPQFLQDWVRPGIMLYGVSPFSHKSAAEIGLLPVMTLTAVIIEIKRCRLGDKVGYGCHWVCPNDMTIAVISIGYGDGYPRHAPSGSPVLINGKICQLVGIVSMDMITVDLGDVDAKVGDEAIVWGKGLPVEGIATAAKTIPYELLCHTARRVKFVLTSQ